MPSTALTEARARCALAASAASHARWAYESDRSTATLLTLEEAESECVAAHNAWVAAEAAEAAMVDRLTSLHADAARLHAELATLAEELRAVHADGHIGWVVRGAQAYADIATTACHMAACTLDAHLRQVAS